MVVMISQSISLNLRKNFYSPQVILYLHFLKKVIMRSPSTII